MPEMSMYVNLEFHRKFHPILMRVTIMNAGKKWGNRCTPSSIYWENSFCISASGMVIIAPERLNIESQEAVTIISR